MTLNCQSKPKKKEQSWKYHHTLTQVIRQSHGYKTSMALTKKQTHKLVEYNCGSINKQQPHGHLQK